MSEVVSDTDTTVDIEEWYAHQLPCTCPFGKCPHAEGECPIPPTWRGRTLCPCGARSAWHLICAPCRSKLLQWLTSGFFKPKCVYCRRKRVLEHFIWIPV